MELPFKELLSEQALNEKYKILTPIYLKKGTLLISDLKLEKNAYFIQEGIIKAFLNTEDKEVIFWFAKEGDILNSANGYYYKQKGYENYRALEDCVLLKINIAQIQKLYIENLEISNWSRLITEREAIRVEERLLDYLVLSPEKRYLKLRERNPDLFQRVQLKEIASYIGISAVSLSRIRARLLEK